MIGENISVSEANNQLSNILGLPVTPSSFNLGILNLEIGSLVTVTKRTPGGKTFDVDEGDYSLSIEGNWVVRNVDGKIILGLNSNHSDIFGLIGKFTLSNIDINKIEKKVTFLFNTGFSIEVSNYKDRDYFALYTNRPSKKWLALNSDFEMKRKNPGI